MTPHSITIRHNFEAGHRLPHLEGKCQSLHGHSWWTDVTIGADHLVSGILTEYGDAKAWLRGWIDTNLDHGLILGHDDPLAELLTQYGKVYRMPPGQWPTVETMAEHIGRVTDDWCRKANSLGHLPRMMCTQVRVQETHVNAATWTHPAIATPYPRSQS